MSRPRILLTDAQERSMLAVIRCLDHAGYRVTATASSRLAPGLWSRSCTARQIVPDALRSVEDSVTALAAIARSAAHEVLIPGTDAALYAVSLLRDRLSSWVQLGLPDHGVVLSALDRAHVTARAAEVGLQSPEARVCKGYEEALEAARTFGFPVLVKPVQTVVQLDHGLVRYASALVADEVALSAAHERLGTCIVQRRSPGAVISFGGVVDNRRLLGWVTSRYRRMWPPGAGSVSFSETFTTPPALLEQVGAFVNAIGWRGLFELELIEGDDGTIRAIDFNPRAYGSIALAEAAGVPLARLWCDSLRGEDPAPLAGRAGVRYRWEDADIRHAFWQLRNGDARGAASTLRPRTHVSHGFVEAQDPLPLVARMLERMAHRRSR